MNKNQLIKDFNLSVMVYIAGTFFQRYEITSPGFDVTDALYRLAQRIDNLAILTTGKHCRFSHNWYGPQFNQSEYIALNGLYTADGDYICLYIQEVGSSSDTI